MYTFVFLFSYVYNKRMVLSWKWMFFCLYFYDEIVIRLMLTIQKVVENIFLLIFISNSRYYHLVFYEFEKKTIIQENQQANSIREIIIYFMVIYISIFFAVRWTNWFNRSPSWIFFHFSVIDLTATRISDNFYCSLFFIVKWISMCIVNK